MDEIDKPDPADASATTVEGEASQTVETAAPSLDVEEIDNSGTIEGNSQSAVLESEVMNESNIETPAGIESVQAAPAPDLKSGSGELVLAMSKIQSLRVKVQAVLGTVPLKISELANIEKGDLLELDTKIGDPISIYANGDLIAKAEIVVTPDEPPRFGLTITEVVSAEASVA